MRSDAGKPRTSKHNRARMYLSGIINNDGDKGCTTKTKGDHSQAAYNYRKESDLFALAEIFAEAAGKAAPIVEDCGDSRLQEFHRRLLAEPFILISQWEQEDERRP